MGAGWSINSAPVPFQRYPSQDTISTWRPPGWDCSGFQVSLAAACGIKCKPRISSWPAVLCTRLGVPISITHMLHLTPGESVPAASPLSLKPVSPKTRLPRTTSSWTSKQATHSPHSNHTGHQDQRGSSVTFYFFKLALLAGPWQFPFRSRGCLR